MMQTAVCRRRIYRPEQQAWAKAREYSAGKVRRYEPYLCEECDAWHIERRRRGVVRSKLSA